MPRPVSASAPDGDGAPSAVEHREGFVLGEAAFSGAGFRVCKGR